MNLNNSNSVSVNSDSIFMEEPQFQKAKYLSKISIISKGDYRFLSYLGQQCYYLLKWFFRDSSGYIYISLSMQIRIFSRRYCSSRRPLALLCITRILLFSPSAKPNETLFSRLLYATMPSQGLSIISADFLQGFNCCHFNGSFQ